MASPVPSYPLAWPSVYPRTSASARKSTTFTTSFQQARWDVLGELMRLHARDIVLSTNLPVHHDEPVYNYEPQDPGVAIWFLVRKNHGFEQMAIACDVWQTVHQNIVALAATMMGLRGMYRFGTTHVLDAMIAGLSVPLEMGLSNEEAPFSEPEGPDLDAPVAQWWYVLGFVHLHQATPEEAEKRYRARVKQAHPDRGGTDEAMRIFNEAIAQARAHFAPKGEPTCPK